MYIAEHLPRLGQISVKLDFSDDPKSIAGIGIRQANLLVQASNTYSIPLPITETNLLESAKIKLANVAKDSISITLSVNSSNPDLDSSFMSFSQSDHQKWSVKDLVRKTPRNSEKLNEFQFCCAQCDNQIINSSEFKFLDMPSEFWYEMMDFWHCHKPHEHHHNENDKNFNTKLVPAKGNVHIGSLYLFMSGVPSSCLKCGEILGTEDNQAVKIYKWKVNLKYGDVTESYSPHAFVFYSILDKVNLSATRKFSIKYEESVLNLWVSNLGLNVSVTNRPVMRNALKLLCVEQPGSTEDEVLEVPREVFESFQKHIYEVNSQLPEHCRYMEMSENGQLTQYLISYLAE